MDIKFERSNRKIKEAMEKENVSIDDRWLRFEGGNFKVCERLRHLYGHCVVCLGADGTFIRAMTTKGEKLIPAYDFISFRHVGWAKDTTKEYVKDLESRMCDITK